MEMQVDFSTLTKEVKIDILPPKNTLIFKLLQEVKPIEDAKVLEIGIGNTEHLPFIFQKNKGILYFGADSSELLIHEALSNHALKVKEGQAQFIKTGGDEKLDFGDGFFDCCFTANTLYFWADPILNFMEIYRVLKPGGKFDLAIVEKKSGGHLPWIQIDFTFYKTDEVKTFFQKAGFVNIEVKKVMEEITDKDGQKITRPFVIISGQK
ncbi:methyltransferase domain-containing protein [Pedobacter sp. PAMC26386]|nr:methyltransferase domain-containing protein [Pedobacter sp. PAMC26386]